MIRRTPAGSADQVFESRAVQDLLEVVRKDEVVLWKFDACHVLINVTDHQVNAADRLPAFVVDLICSTFDGPCR